MKVKRKKLSGLGKRWKHKEVYILLEQNILFACISHDTAQGRNC